VVVLLMPYGACKFIYKRREKVREFGKDRGEGGLLLSIYIELKYGC